MHVWNGILQVYSLYNRDNDTDNPVDAPRNWQPCSYDNSTSATSDEQIDVRRAGGGRAVYRRATRVTRKSPPPFDGESGGVKLEFFILPWTLYKQVISYK